MAHLKDTIYALPYEQQNRLVDHLNIREEFDSTLVEIWQGSRERVCFVDYKDIDNGLDYAMRQQRTREAAETVVDIIMKNENTYNYMLEKLCAFLNIPFDNNYCGGSNV